jgi:hypothetical protein
VFSWGWGGLALGTALLCLAFGWGPAVLAMLGHGILYVFVLAPLVNGLGHWSGGRRSELDPSWIAIRILAALRLVVVLGSPLRTRGTR